MSNKQLVILWIGAGLIVLMCLVPPWLYTSTETTRSFSIREGPEHVALVATVKEAGYDFLFASRHEYIASGRFALQILVVSLLTAIGIYTLRVKGK